MGVEPTILTAEANPQFNGDEELLLLMREGDEGSIRTLVAQNNHRLFRLVRAILQNDADAEDVVQETYVRALSNLASFRGETRLSTWLSRIALNAALGHLQKGARTEPLDLLDLDLFDAGANSFSAPQAPATPEAEAARAQAGRALEHAIDRLPREFRLVFVLREVEGLSVEETATQLQINSVTVRTRLFRAKRMMRAAIASHLSPCFDAIYPFGGKRCAAMANRVIASLPSPMMH